MKKLTAILLTFALVFTLATSALGSDYYDYGCDFDYLYHYPCCCDDIYVYTPPPNPPCPTVLIPIITQQPSNTRMRVGVFNNSTRLGLSAQIQPGGGALWGVRWYFDGVPTIPRTAGTFQAHAVVFNALAKDFYAISNTVTVEFYYPTAWQLFWSGAAEGLLGPIMIPIILTIVTIGYGRGFERLIAIPILLLGLPIGIVIGLAMAIPAGIANVRRWR
ncbi:MAG: hypothetical protein FWB76_06165 [Oscillospiraceae bacterium]|nr:hypothetical protein [Oscillospiraceae bacterium]